MITDLSTSSAPPLLSTNIITLNTNNITLNTNTMTTKKGGHAVPMQPVQPKPLTEEEKRAAQWRAIAQKIESTAQMVLCNLANNPAAIEACTDNEGNIDLAPITDAAVKAGARFAEKIGDTLGVIYRDLFEEKKEDKAE